VPSTLNPNRELRAEGAGMEPSAGPGTAHRRGIGHAAWARVCSLAASRNIVRPGSPAAARVSMTRGRRRALWSGSSAAANTSG